MAFFLLLTVFKNRPAASLSHGPPEMNGLWPQTMLEPAAFWQYCRPSFRIDLNFMLFKNVVIQSLAAVDPPIRITSQEITDRLEPAMQRLGIRGNLLEDISGIGARRFWNNGTQPSDAATLAAEQAIEEAGIDRMYCSRQPETVRQVSQF
jgi:hypothetical protein